MSYIPARYGYVLAVVSAILLVSCGTEWSTSGACERSAQWVSKDG